MIIRELTSEDIPALFQLARKTYSEAFGHTFKPSDLAYHLENNLSSGYFQQARRQDVIFIAEERDTIVGFVQFGDVKIPHKDISPKDQEIRRLYVQADWQNKGIGKLLMEAALGHKRLKDAKNIYLDVWENNTGAQNFYKNFGFEIFGEHTLIIPSGSPMDKELIMIRRTNANT